MCLHLCCRLILLLTCLRGTTCLQRMYIQRGQWWQIGLSHGITRKIRLNAWGPVWCTALCTHAWGVTPATQRDATSRGLHAAERAYLAEQVALGNANILLNALLLSDGHLRSGHTRETR